MGAVFLGTLWQLKWRKPQERRSPDALAHAARSCGQASVFSLGVANLLNLVFMNADILLLGAMTTTDEVGRYSAACKPLYIIFTGFWLLTDASLSASGKARSGAPWAQSPVAGCFGASRGLASAVAFALACWLRGFSP